MTYSSLTGPFLSEVSIKSVLWNPRFWIIGMINILHIFASYLAFQNLNTGVAMATFYTHPLINVTLSSLFLGTQFPTHLIPYFILCIIGVAIIYIPNIMGNILAPGSLIIGFIAIAISALTESIITVFYKGQEHENPADSLFSLYLIPTIILTLISPQFGEFTSTAEIGKIIGFNAIIGFVGYFARFFSIPRIPIEWFSILSFAGVISAYIFGYSFFGENITGYHIFGTLAIIFAIWRIDNILSKTEIDKKSDEKM